MKVMLRPLMKSDAETSVRWRNDPAVWTFTTFSADRTITIEDERAWIERVLADVNSRRFAILADDNYVGNIYLTSIQEGSAEYHIFVGEKTMWGHGVARRASEQIIAYGRDALGLNQLELRVHPQNAAAMKLYSSLGFVRTGQAGDFVCMRLTFEPDFKSVRTHPAFG